MDGWVIFSKKYDIIIRHVVFELSKFYRFYIIIIVIFYIILAFSKTSHKTVLVMNKFVFYTWSILISLSLLEN